MSPTLDGKLYAAALDRITHIWGDTMDTMQRASLANQIVREIERRGIIAEIETAARSVARAEIKALCDAEVEKGYDGCPHDESFRRREGAIDMADHLSATISQLT